MPGVFKIPAPRPSGPATAPPMIIPRGDRGWVAPVVVGVVAIGGYFFVLKPWLDKQKMRADLTNDQASTIKPKQGKVLKTIGGQTVTGVNLSTIVTDIHSAIKQSWLWPDDEDRAVRVFKTIPFGTREDPGKYVKEVERMYLEKYSRNLKDDMADELNDVQFMKVKYWFE